MTFFTARRPAIAVFSLAVWASSVLPQPPSQPSKGIDSATVAAYEKLGAVYGAMGTEDDPRFSKGVDNAEKGLPGFLFDGSFPDKKLPPVSAPFGIEFRFSKAPDARLKHLAGLEKLVHLDLTGADLTDAGLKELTGLTKLTTLHLWYTKVTDAGLKDIARIKSLRSLTLGGTDISDRGLKELAGLENLETLRLILTKVTDAGVKELPAFEGLVSLDLGDTVVTDRGLKELAGMTKLVHLHLNHSKITSEGLQELTGLKNLKMLTMRNTRVTDAGLKHLSRLGNLEHLDLFATDVTGVQFGELASLKKLRTIGVGSDQLSDASLRVLRDGDLLHRLSRARGKDGSRPPSGHEVLSLDLRSAPVTDVGLKELVGLKNLEVLNLNDTLVTDAGVATLQEALPRCKITR